MSDGWLTILPGDCRAILVELNPEYIEQAETRTQDIPLGLGA